MPHLSTLYHLATVITYIFTLHYAFEHLQFPMLREAFKNFDPGLPKYLTVWNLILIVLILFSKVGIFIKFVAYGAGIVEERKDPSRTADTMRQGLAIGFHALIFLNYTFAVYYDYTYTIVPHNVTRVHSAFGGKFKFLTFWDAILQAIFFLICLLNDFAGSNAVNPKKPPFARKLKDYLHASLGFPISMFVGVTFWVLMFVDRELVLPKAMDPYFPWWLNHLMHTMIMVTTIIEMIVAPRQYPKRSRGLGILVSFMLAYLVWIHVIYYKSGIWVYPVMEVLTQPLRIVFFAVLLTFCTILYFVGEALNNLIWGNEHTKHKKSHAKSK